MKKILCICNHGQVRSASLKWAIWNLNGACIDTSPDYLKDYIKYEAIAVGAHCTSDDTMKMLIDWSDITVDLSDNDNNIQSKLIEMAKEKYIRKDIGRDIWHNPFNEELKKMMNEFVKKVLK